MKTFTAIITLAACALASSAAQATTVKYMLWDSSQLPAYRQCAADFQKRRPDVQIKIRQAGWDDYWSAIATGFISETAPDVFVNHLSKYPEIVKNDLLVDLQPWMVRDQIDARLYKPELLRAWARAGQQFGLPKDWDTVALAVNLSHARKQGVSLTELQNMDWNPRDGGSFERIVKRLTVDAQGHNANSPRFDPQRVAMHGYQNPGPGGMTGQTEWSHFAVSNGFQFQEAPWSPRLQFDDTKLAETMDYLAGLTAKGLSAPVERVRSLGASTLFVSQRAAIIPDGSWMIPYYKQHARFEYAWVPLPQGPIGTRASMLNGTADSIWVGSKVKDEAWAWVKYLASPDCQNTVARLRGIFPAITSEVDTAQHHHRASGVDISAFLTMAQSHTFLPPIVDKASQINEIVGGAMEAILLGQGRAQAVLKEANARANQPHR